MHATPLAGVRVLLVDDDEYVREALRDYFVECGAVVVTADSGRAAFDAFQLAPPDVLVSDIRMPGEDGFWLISAVRALRPIEGGDLPAVAVTGDIIAATRAMASGFQAVHEKPPCLPELAALVERLAGCCKT